MADANKMQTVLLIPSLPSETHNVTMSIAWVELIRSDLAVEEELDREVILQGLADPDESLIVGWLEKLISWTSNDQLATRLRSMRLMPALLKLLEKENEEIVDLAASTMSYLSGRSAAGPYTRLWSFMEHSQDDSQPPRRVTLPITEPSYSSGAGLGWKTWNAAIILVEYLGTQLSAFHDKDVLELGCGTGLSGIFCARFGARSVLMTDYNQTVLETVSENAKSNHLTNVAIQRLDWHELLEDRMDETSSTQKIGREEGIKGGSGDIQLENDKNGEEAHVTRNEDNELSSRQEFGSFETIIGSDIVYNPEHAEIVPKVLNRLLAHNDRARAYIAVGPRPEASKFMNIMANDFDFELVERKEPMYIDAEGESSHFDMLVYKRK